MKNAKVLRAIVCEEEQFEDQHDNQQYIYLRKKMIKQFSDVFKKNLTPKEVHHTTPWSSKAFFVQRPGSPDDDPSVRLVMYVNQIIDRVGYPMDGSFHLLRRLDPQGTCFAEVDLC